MDESIESILRRTHIHERAVEGRESSFTELYKECQRNHAAALGWHATDGCNEYIHNTAYIGMYCEACGCHRNFHNKVLVPVKKNERYQPNAKQYSDNDVRDSDMISETSMVCDQGNKKECDRMTKEEPLLVEKGFEANQTNQIQGGILSTPGLAYSPFMIFMNEFREKCHFENNFCGVALTCGQKWKSMTLAERAPYVAMAEKRMAEKIKYDELKHKYDESSSKSNKEENNEEEEDDEESNEEEEDDEECSEEEDDDEESFEEEDDDEESIEDDDNEESYEEEEDDEESNEDDDDEEGSEEEEDEESNESNSESNNEESDEEEDDKESDEEEDDKDSDESYFESNANDNDDEEEIVFVNSEPDRAFDFEFITADTGCGEQFKAPDSNDVISKQLETSAFSEDNEDVDETGMLPTDIELVIELANVSRSKAVKAMKAAEGDLVEAITALTR